MTSTESYTLMNKAIILCRVTIREDYLPFFFHCPEQFFFYRRTEICTRARHVSSWNRDRTVCNLHRFAAASQAGVNGETLYQASLKSKSYLHSREPVRGRTLGVASIHSPVADRRSRDRVEKHARSMQSNGNDTLHHDEEWDRVNRGAQSFSFLYPRDYQRNLIQNF